MVFSNSFKIDFGIRLLLTNWYYKIEVLLYAQILVTSSIFHIYLKIVDYPLAWQRLATKKHERKATNNNFDHLHILLWALTIECVFWPSNHDF